MTNTILNTEEDSSKPQRVVSLLGASTETIYRLGLGSKLVGRSHECDFPPACLSLPCISRPRLDVDASSLEIDEAVRSHSAAGEPVYKLDDAVISQLKPDLIIAQDHCRVCAITPGDISNSEFCANIPQLVVKPSTLQDCMNDITTVANGMGYPERGVALQKTLELRMDRVRQVVATHTDGSMNNNPEIKRPRVALLEWCDPIMGCGYWLPELVDVAGGEALHCPPPGGATPTISLQALMDSKPDVVVFALCGFGLARAAKEIVMSTTWGGSDNNNRLEELMDMCHRRVFVVDGNYLINRSGPRLVESAEALAEAIHPALLGHFGHFGTDLLSTMDEAIAMIDNTTGEKQRATTSAAKIRPPPFEEKESQKKKPESLPSSKPEEAVRMQLQHLQNGDMSHAFSLNSTANQMRWCSPDRFAAVLKSHGDFSRLLSEPAHVGESKETNGIATVRVTLPKTACSSAVELLFTMVAEIPEGAKDTMAWYTEKVGLAN
eukprot:CAMPEP_0198284808 /NCGR_PEP_ID=MMETSP1449-20131203/4223_1 /TAXON_ID=420275 /ORGANISM="Attheya septentrionalis, Strain CCMP2084" /LENGTH=492 /DNA_ID=CAMNT_0043982023 /DNA_START=197 /DNA_END=1675 /DNA_ORIENTATION=-